jgi:hypothetical protein
MRAIVWVKSVLIVPYSKAVFSRTVTVVAYRSNPKARPIAIEERFE